MVLSIWQKNVLKILTQTFAKIVAKMAKMALTQPKTINLGLFYGMGE